MPLGIFCTFPQPFLSTLGGFIDQVVGTAILMAGIFAIGDDDNKTIDEGTPSTHYNIDEYSDSPFQKNFCSINYFVPQLANLSLWLYLW
jgi:hypothetical protein